MSAIDLLVVNYNTAEKLVRLVTTLSEDDNNLWNLYIADNGSTDGSKTVLSQLVSKYRIAHADYGSNLGYSRASNLLATYGEAPIIGILNADVWLKSSDVAKIKRSFDNHAKIAILGPKQRNEQGKITHAGIFGTNTAPKHRGWQEADTQDVKYRDLREAVTVSGSAYFIRRSVWEELANCTIYRETDPKSYGAFLTTPHYYEETWCSYHARAHDYKVFYDGSISIGHTWRASTGADPILQKYFKESRAMFRKACADHGIECD